MSVDVRQLLEGFSKAMYSTWFYYKPDRLLLDAGEGVATALGNRVFGIERVLLSHGHIDHISGLPTLIYARTAGMGDVEKPLTIYYPKGDFYVETLRDYVGRTHRRLTFELHWMPLEPGDSIALEEEQKQHSRRVVTFPTQHVRGRLTLGYHIVERRRKLKPEFAALSQAEIHALVRDGQRDRLMQDYEQKLLTYLGDTTPMHTDQFHNTELLMHEATLVEPEDVKYPVHSTVEEAVAVAAHAQPKALLLYHISSRYRRDQVEAAVAACCAKHGLTCDVWVQYLNRLWKVNEMMGNEEIG
ncbi:MAG: MBL fold metallo-hydrolase [Abditibacteriales bacterium]|nr:MBL fold metallo-hydrolase [Abditibacteriales bacterium]MDW8364756.1 MBL fold metallo-hydrolase [Abditibacteriales bacterium]